MEVVETTQYIIAEVANEKLGIDIKYVDSIIVMQNITRVPKSQSYFKGVINLRGDIIPVMSLRLRLGKGSDEYTAKTRIVIVKPEGQDSVGIIIDEVKEVAVLANNEIDTLNYDKIDEKENYSLGIGKVDNELISLLNVTKLIMGNKDNIPL